MTRTLKTITCLLLLLFSSIHLAGKEHSQAVSIDIRAQNLTDALTELAIITGIHFSFPTHLADSITVDKSFEKVELTLILEELLGKNNLEFQWYQDTKVIIYENQNRYPLTGFVVDSETGEPLPYASIYNSEKTYTYSDQDGSFQLTDMPAGQLELTVQYLGYDTRVFATNPADKNPVNIRLTRSPIEGNAVEVVSDGGEFPKAGQAPGQLAIDTEAFSILPRIGEQDIFDSISLLPGIQSDEFGSSGIEIRGSMPSENLIVLDGITLYHVDHAFGLHTAINSNTIENAKVYRSGFPAKYGGRSSGLLEFTSKSAGFEKMRVVGGINQSAGNLSLEVPLNKNVSFVVAGRKSISGFLLEDIYRGSYEGTFNSLLNSADDQTSPDISFYDTFAKINYLANTRNIFSVSYFQGKDKFALGYETDVLAGSDTLIAVSERVPVFDHINSWGNTGFSTRWLHKQNNLNVESTFSLSQYAADGWEEHNFVDSLRTSDGVEVGIVNEQSIIKNYLTDLSLSLNAELKMSANHFFDSGITIANIASEYSETELIENISVQHSMNKSMLLSTYAQHRAKIAALETNLGLRYTRYTLTGSNRFEPRISLSYRLSENLYAKAGFGTYSQYVNRISDSIENVENNNSWLLSNESILPNTSEQLVAGIAYQREHIHIEAEAYHKTSSGFFSPDFKNLVFPDEHNLYVVNNSSRSIQGIDLLMRINRQRFSGWFSYSFGDSEMQLRNDVGDVFRMPLLNQVKHSVKLVARYNLPKGFVVSLVSQFRSGKPYVTPIVTEEWIQDVEETDYGLALPESMVISRMPAQKRLDFSIDYNVKLHPLQGRFNLTLFNVLNNKNILDRIFLIEDGAVGTYDVSLLGFKPIVSFEMEF